MVPTGSEHGAGSSPAKSDSFLARLPGEIRLWQDQGIITAEQARAIASSYDIPAEEASRQRARGRLVTILAIFGALLVGLGVILFFAANWDAVPRAVRLAMILVGIPTVYGVGYRLRYVQKYERVGTAVLLLGAVLYGAGIHLVAQVYNFPLNDPKLFTFWFLGVLPLAYLTRSQAVLLLSLGLFLGGVGFWLGDWLEGSSESAVIVVFALYLTLGPLLYGLGKLHSNLNNWDVWRTFAAVYEPLGLVVTLAAIYLLSFRYMYDSETGVDAEVATELWVLFYVAGAGAVAAIIGSAAIQIRRRPALMNSLSEAIPLLSEGASILIVLATAYLVVFAEAGNDVLYPVLFNLLLLASIIGLVFAGYVWRREMFINVALVFFGLGIVTRYFELSWGLLDRSLVFVVAGLILLGGGYLLERGRNRVVNSMEAQASEQRGAP